VRRSGWRPGRRLAILVGALALLVLLAFTHPVRVALLALAVLPSALGSLPVDPLVHLTPPPTRDSFAFDYAAGSVEGDIYSPGDGRQHGALILVLGARPVERDDPILVRFAEGLSRAGLVVMIPVSSNLSAGRIIVEEVDAIVREVDLLRERPEVDPSRIGILGFSVGGSVAIQAAADPRLDGKLVLVNAFGSFYDAVDLIRAASTHSLAYAGLDEPWEPAPLVTWVIARQLVDTLPDPHDRQVLEQVFLLYDESAREQLPTLTPTGRAALGLLEGLPPAETEAALAQMPPATLARLQGIRPSEYLDRVTTRLFIMHDRGDHFVPYTESRRLVATMPPDHLARYTELDMFDHVVPNRAPTEVTFYVEALRLLGQLYAILLYVL
jgi:pimeloyl-ACP methyl ester carboxylesterase